MSGCRWIGIDGARAAKTAVPLAILAALAGCSGSNLLGTSQPEPPPAAAAPAPPTPAPPPVELAGPWELSAAAGGACVMNFADTSAAPGAAAAASADSGTIAPGAGCPGNFFTSREWTFAAGTLIVRDFKGRPLAQLSYAGDRFQGQDANLGSLMLSKPQ